VKVTKEVTSTVHASLSVSEEDVEKTAVAVKRARWYRGSAPAGSRGSAVCKA